MFQRVKRLRKHFFNWGARGIFDTPPVRCDAASNVVVLSQTYHADLTMFLLAAKSFASFLRPQRFVVVDDGLTDAQRSLVERHLDRVEFAPRLAVDVGSFPRGGCWERLLTVARLSREHYVIQLDSDTVTLASPEEVIRCAAEGRSFTLGTNEGQAIGPVLAAARFAQGLGTALHVQIHAEQALDRIPTADQRRYVRGCAGFAGYASGSFDMELLEQFNGSMQALIGREKWAEWGSEQVSSNFVVANTLGAVVLPIERYVNWMPGKDTRDARLLHFIGHRRFNGLRYLTAARVAISALRRLRHSPRG